MHRRLASVYMGTTGLIYVAIVAAWAAYLVPMWLRRHDERSRLKAVERYSSAMRVLSRRTDSDDRARYVVRPKGSEVPRVIAPAPTRSAAQVRARRLAAMRRRRVLSTLTLALMSVGSLAFFSLLPRWSALIPVGLLLSFVVLTRWQLRRQSGHEHRIARPLTPATRLDVARTRTVEDEATVEVALPAEAVDEPPLEEGLWDPVPVTLPTYVYKEKAPRTVRTVSLSGPEESEPEYLAEPEYLVEPPVESPADVPRAVGD